MIFKRIFIGQWNPGSTTHLKEFYELLSTGESSYFQKGEFSGFVKKMKLTQLEYLAEAFNRVTGKLNGDMHFDVMEDGVAVVSKKIKKFDKKEISVLRDYVNNKFFFLLDKVYSRGVSVPQILDELQVDNPIVLVISKATEKDLLKIYKKMSSVPYKKLAVKQGDIWIGDKLVVVNDKKFSEADLAETIRYLMFARVFELNLKRSLHAQQKLWIRLEEIRAKKYLKNKQLPQIRDLALDIQGQVSFFKSRSNQMNRFLEWRKGYIDDYLTNHFLEAVFKNFFTSLKANQHYLHEQWVMTDSYAISTVESISLLYVDNERKELRTLQKLFLISAVITFLSLGNLLGSTIITYDTHGDLISYGIMNSWDNGSFIFFGIIALSIAFFIYYIFYLFFNRLKQSKILLHQKSKK